MPFLAGGSKGQQSCRLLLFVSPIKLLAINSVTVVASFQGFIFSHSFFSIASAGGQRWGAKRGKRKLHEGRVGSSLAPAGFPPHRIGATARTEKRPPQRPVFSAIF
jgi:hypothetical protein